MKNKEKALKIVIIGGSAAGPKVASKARRMDQNADITLIQRDENLSMATCGYPYFIGGLFDDKNKLICTPTGRIRDPKFFADTKKIHALTSTEATKIDRQNKTVVIKDLSSGSEKILNYDKLVICTGSSAIKPPIKGIEAKGISLLKDMKDAEYLKDIAKNKKARKAVIVGGGLIGIETAEALELAGMDITIVEMQNQILPFLDFEMAKLTENYLRSKNIKLITGAGASEFISKNGNLTAVKLSNGEQIECELAVISIGVKPNIKLAKECGLEIGQKNGIKVNKFMQTSDPDIYAAGDCVEILNAITGEKMLWPMGDAANLQGRLVGQNIIIGNTAEYPGTIMTGICKIFDYEAGSTGLSEAMAKKEGFANIVTLIHAAPDKPGFMGGKPIIIKLVANKYARRLLGAQIIGQGDVSKRIAIAATAIQANMTVSDLICLDLPYAPPFSPAIDNFLTAIHVLENKLYDRLEGISSIEVKKLVDAKENIQLLDVRGEDEFETTQLGLNEMLIPLGQLRDKAESMLKDKDQLIVTYCKISLRGYEAYSILKSLGYTNVKALEGGLLSWPF